MKALVLPILLAACGSDTSGGATTLATTLAETGQGTTVATPTTDPGTTAAVTTTGTAAATTGGEADADASSAGSSGGVAETGDVSTSTDATTSVDGSTTELPASTTDTGGDPPRDPCADQDDPPPAVDPAEAINDDPAYIQVYVNNVENLKIASEECAGDWTDLIYYMKTIKPSPDLFFVQQISNKAQLDTLVDRMTDEMPGIFEGVIADADPWNQGSPCGSEKAKQTNAVIYRAGRFDKVGDKHVWQSWAHKGGECVRNNQARTRNVMIKLHDKIADRDISVASLHWSTFQGDGPDPACAKKNVIEADEKLHKRGYGGALVIFGGDFNEPDRQDDGDLRPWYAEVNGDADGPLNYRDPVYRACADDGGLQACLDDNWTIGGERRIDMLFAKDGDGCRARTRRAHTITFNEAEDAAQEVTGDADENLNYSDHRGVRAEVYYP
jgi:hypothetical protein